MSVGRAEWTATLTLDVEGEKGSGRLILTAVLPFAPEDARARVTTATLEAAGRTVALDSAGQPIGR